MATETKPALHGVASAAVSAPGAAPRFAGLRVPVMVLGSAGVFLAINHQFLLGLAGFQPLGNSYLYYLIGIFLAVAFLTLPFAARLRGRMTWLNLLLAALALGSTGYLGAHGLDILQKGWEYDAPLSADIAATILILLVLEGVRRAGGPILLFTALLFGTYPLSPATCRAFSGERSSA